MLKKKKSETPELTTFSCFDWFFSLYLVDQLSSYLKGDEEEEEDKRKEKKKKFFTRWLK